MPVLRLRLATAGVTPATSNASRAARRTRLTWVEAGLAVAAFAALCVVVLAIAPRPEEPDDGAYRASIVAMTEGHFLTLSGAQATALAAKLGDGSGLINQWVELSGGRYISEKDPGYPFLAAPFQALGMIRWAPLFFCALACLALFIGARRWLGRFGGLAAVGLYCSSGAAVQFGWRDYMPTFTDASLIAAGSGALLWALLATEVSSRRRTWAGLAGFAAIEVAAFVRYTDVVVLGCAVVTVIVARRRPRIGVASPEAHRRAATARTMTVPVPCHWMSRNPAAVSSRVARPLVRALWRRLAIRVGISQAENWSVSTSTPPGAST